MAKEIGSSDKEVLQLDPVPQNNSPNNKNSAPTSAAQKLGSVSQVISSQFNCSICSQVVIDSSVLACGHMFCSFCIRMRLSVMNSCPQCGAYSDFYVATKFVDNVLNKLLNITQLPEPLAIRQATAADRQTILQSEEAAITATAIDTAKLGQGQQSQARTALFPEWLVPAGIGDETRVDRNNSRRESRNESSSSDNSNNTSSQSMYEWYAPEFVTSSVDFVEWETYILTDEYWEEGYDYP